MSMSSLSLVVLFLDLFGLLFLIGKMLFAPLPLLTQYKTIASLSTSLEETIPGAAKGTLHGRNTLEPHIDAQPAPSFDSF